MDFNITSCQLATHAITIQSRDGDGNRICLSKVVDFHKEADHLPIICFSRTTEPGMTTIDHQ